MLLDLLRGCFKYDRDNRFTLDTIMAHKWFDEVRGECLRKA